MNSDLIPYFAQICARARAAIPQTLYAFDFSDTIGFILPQAQRRYPHFSERTLLESSCFINHETLSFLLFGHNPTEGNISVDQIAVTQGFYSVHLIPIPEPGKFPANHEFVMLVTSDQIHLLHAYIGYYTCRHDCLNLSDRKRLLNLLRRFQEGTYDQREEKDLATYNDLFHVNETYLPVEMIVEIEYYPQPPTMESITANERELQRLAQEGRDLETWDYHETVDQLYG